jgi:hypothetical protein
MHLGQHLTNLSNLTRDVLKSEAYSDRRHISPFLAADKLARMQERLDGHFFKYPDEIRRSCCRYKFYVLDM